MANTKSNSKKRHVIIAEILICPKELGKNIVVTRAGKLLNAIKKKRAAQLFTKVKISERGEADRLYRI